MAKVASLMYLVTYSQTHMLIAGAIIKGWATGNAETANKNGVIAHLEQVGTYDANSLISVLFTLRSF
jgi:hypothetical protein